MDMTGGAVLFCFIVLVSLQRCLYCFSELGKVEHLVRQWSPLIWLSPEEKYMPLSAEEFLDNVYVADDNGKRIQSIFNKDRGLPKADANSFYLVTKNNLETLKSRNGSFLFGKNPNTNSIPIYALVTYCNYLSKNCIRRDNVNNEKNENKFYFYVSYWIFYPYNEGKEVCFLGKVPAPRIFNACFGKLKTMGNHVGDWEHMSLSFSGKPFPDKLFLAVHDAGVYYDYNEKMQYFKYESKVKRKGVVQVPRFPTIVRTQGGHPVLFSANGSHGLWGSPGEHDYVRVPKLTDKNGYGFPWKTWNNVRTYHLGQSPLPEWMRFKGKWGNPKTNCLLLKKFGLCEYTDGPVGFLWKKKDFYCWPK